MTWRALSILGLAATLTTALALPPADGATPAVTRVAAVWTEPADGYGFLRAAVDGAQHELDLSLYELDDPTLEAELVARARAGVDVRVLLNSAYDGREDNAAAASRLVAGGVHVAWAPSGQIFHAKYVVVDGRAAYVGTGNLVAYDYPSTRDFWVEVTTPADVAAIEATFASDFLGRGAAAAAAPGLVWSPGATATLVAIIDGARHSLLVENEEMDDATIESALAAAAARGVRVSVVMTYSSEWSGALARLRRAGVHVSLLGSSQIYIHAKVICADCGASSGTLFVGSENFSVSSLDYNRELGVVTNSAVAVEAVERAVDSDAARGTVAS